MYPIKSPDPEQVNLMRLQERIGFLETQIHNLNEKLVAQDIELVDLHRRLPDTWLLDKSYWKRALTAYAYVTVVGLAIGIPLYCIIIIISFILAGMQ